MVISTNQNSNHLRLHRMHWSATYHTSAPCFTKSHCVSPLHHYTITHYHSVSPNITYYMVSSTASNQAARKSKDQATRFGSIQGPWTQVYVQPWVVRAATMSRGGRYIDEKLSKADKSVFLKLSAIYRYRKMEIVKLSKNYRYRKMHQILADN